MFEAMTKPIHRRSVTELVELIKKEEISPVEVVEFYFDRIEDFNDEINAFITLAKDDAMEQAVEAEEAVKNNEDLGLLHGIPIGMKDIQDVAGMRTTYGLKAFEDNKAEKNSIAADRLEDAGAIIIGKTNIPEFSFRTNTTNQIQGTTVTPFDQSKTSLGSSGGSGAAVAGGLSPVALGSDGGGSVRMPSSYCGIFGLKPTFRRIPVGVRTNAWQFTSPFSHIGPMTRTVDDAALLMDVLSGPHPHDPFALPNERTDFRSSTSQSVEGWKIAYSTDMGVYDVEVDVDRIVKNAVDQYEEAGATVEDIDVELGYTLSEIRETHFGPACVRVAERAEHIQTKTGIDVMELEDEEIDPELKDRIQRGRELPALDYKLRGVNRTGLIRKVEEIFDEYDLLVTPTMGTPPFSKDRYYPEEIDGEKIDGASTGWTLTGIYNLTGHPAASVPAGFTDDGLPVGMQIVGPKRADDRILAASATFERLQPWQDSYKGIL